MIFISGLTTKEKELGYKKALICPVCQAYDQFNSFMTYTQMSIFFIPLFKWSKKYYMKSRCCKSIFQIENYIGKDIEKNIDVDLNINDLTLVKESYRENTCDTCGSQIRSDFTYCPKCGNKLG